jgi:hypothetical protein
MTRASPSGGLDGGLDHRVPRSLRVPWGHRLALVPTCRSSFVALAPPTGLHGKGLWVSGMLGTRELVVLPSSAAVLAG